MSDKQIISIARGDGIGPEIMAAVLKILEASQAPLEIEEVQIGESVYKRGISTGIEEKSWDSIYKTKTFLKAPITTPEGGGYRSLNVAVRKTLGLYANVRPCISYHPFVQTKHPKMNVVIIRENEEDLYCGIEYRQTQEVFQSLKFFSRRGTEKVVRYAFEYAVQNNRKKVTCFTKDNIMKISDGMFHDVFQEVAKEYPNIESEHWIVDIGMAKLAATPEQFDVIVVPNLYGDILSDIAAQITGSVGLAGSANIGPEYAMFEAIHGSAPRRAGQNLANPSGLLLASVQMLVHLNLEKHANLIQNAWLKTLEDGLHTYDIFKEQTSKKKLGTKEFAQAVIDRFGEMPKQLQAVAYKKSKGISSILSALKKYPEEKKELFGVDIFVEEKATELAVFVEKIKKQGQPILPLKSISNRGLCFWPAKEPLSDKSDHWRCRFISEKSINPQDILDLLSRLINHNIEVIKTENIYHFDSKIGYSQESSN